MYSSVSSSTNEGGRSVLVIGAGLFGLISAKTLLQHSNDFFSSITIFEKDSAIGGVWSANRIYEGLETNSPLLTYEIPDFPYPAQQRRTGAHVAARDVNRYLHDYAQQFGLEKLIRLNTRVDDVAWDANDARWVVRGSSPRGEFRRSFDYVVVCTGLYHTGNNPLTPQQLSQYAGGVVHSSQMGDPEIRTALANSEKVVVVGAGKSALDLATLLAKGRWRTELRKKIDVTMLYERSHLLSPRKMLRGLISFETLLFCRFVNAWIPFANYPDTFHRLIGETKFGRWSTDRIFDIVSDDFVKSLKQQDLPDTIPNESFGQSLSGAIHVEPPGYLDHVRSGQIQIVKGSIDGTLGRMLRVKKLDGKMEMIKADNVLLATGYKLALPFFTDDTIRTMGLVRPVTVIEDKTDLPYIRLHRLAVPPGAANTSPAKSVAKRAGRNIAFNGFAYSLLNPSVAHVTAHWISDYFTGAIALPDQASIERGVDHFHAWQIKSFGRHGAKGVHIGPHATLHNDVLLGDMGLETGHVQGAALDPIRFLREWFRPIYSGVYAGLASDRAARDQRAYASREGPMSSVGGGAADKGVHLVCAFIKSFVLAVFGAYILLGVLFPAVVHRLPFKLLGGQ